jgi:flagellar biosynthetic protein FlhB
MADQSEQTEKATPRRKEKARKEGNFPAAREFVSAVQFFAFVILATAWFPGWLRGLEGAVRMGLRQSFTLNSLTTPDLMSMLGRLSAAVLLPLAILGAVLLVVTLFFQMASTNMGISLSRLQPKFDRLNPIRKIADMPHTNLTSLLQALVMIPVMFWVTWTLVRDRLSDLVRLPMMSLPNAAGAVGMLIHDALSKASFVLVLLGIVTLVRERARYNKSLRMSKQEIRRESRENEGDPQIKGRVRRMQRSMRQKNMMRNVAEATAVIVNPTHYAVALKYEQGSAAAPTGVAKGRTYLAARIRFRAIENQVPIIENPPLAQALYKSVDVGQEIPAHLYRAVAEILAYIFKIMGRRRS